jgi:hypothetical protein
MPIKIFQAEGPRKIESLEETVNEWLAQSREGRVRQIATSMTAVGEGDEQFQHYVMTILYDHA